MAGGLPGNKNAANNKPWKAALLRAIEARAQGKRRGSLDTIAERLLREAESGNVAALKELADRLDGKAVQPIAGPDGEGPVQIEEIRRTIIDPKGGV